MKSKIVFLIYSMENAGGSERVTANIANKLSEFPNYNVSIISLFGKESYFDLFDAVSFEVLFPEKASYLSAGKRLISRINEIKPKVIIGISIQKFNIFLSLCSLFFNIPVKMIASEHIAYGSVGRFQNLLKRLLYKKFSTIAVLTEADWKLMRNEGFKNVRIVPNASSFFPNPDALVPIDHREKMLLAVGRLEHQKGFDLLIESWGGIYNQFPDWKLIICGDGSQRNALATQVANIFGNSTSCQIIPFTDEINIHFANAQVFVLSSRFEGLPMVMIEAMCFGVPAVAFDCETGPREIITNGNGVLIENQNLNALAEGIAKIINDRDMRVRFSNMCLIERNKYSIESVILKWNEMIN